MTTINVSIANAHSVDHIGTPNTAATKFVYGLAAIIGKAKLYEVILKMVGAKAIDNGLTIPNNTIEISEVIADKDNVTLKTSIGTLSFLAAMKTVDFFLDLDYDIQFDKKNLGSIDEFIHDTEVGINELCTGAKLWSGAQEIADAL